MSPFALALAAGLTSALNVFASKLLVGKGLRLLVVGGWVHLLGSLVCCLGLPFVEVRLSLEPLVLLSLLGMMAVYTLGNALYFSAPASTPLSEIDFFLRTSSLWTFLGGALLLLEPLGPKSLVGAALILASASVFSLWQQSGALRFTGPQLLALGGALAFGAGNLVDKTLSPHFDALSYTLLNQLLTGLGMLGAARVSFRELRSPQFWGRGAGLVALTFALTQLLLILAYQAGGGAGQVILLAQARLIILVPVGVFVLGERERLGCKVLASVLMIMGILVLYGSR
ncbi:MAG: hypothetical protein C4332_16760 [Meiothermus sp.]